MNDELPEGWELAPIQALCRTRKGKKPRNLFDEPAADRLPYLDIEACGARGSQEVCVRIGIGCGAARGDAPRLGTVREAGWR